MIQAKHKKHLRICVNVYICIYIYTHSCTFIYMCVYIHIYAYACGGWRAALGIILKNAIHLLLKPELTINFQGPPSLHTPSTENTGAKH